MIRLILLELFKLRKPLLLVVSFISLLLLTALLFRQFDELSALVNLTLSGIVMLYAVFVGWNQFLPSRFPILGDDSLSGRHPLVSVIARWCAYVLTIGVLLVWTTGLLWWCLAIPEHTSRPFDPEEITALLQFWLIPLLLLYGFSAHIAQKRKLSRWLWAIAGVVVFFRLQVGALSLFSPMGSMAGSSSLITVVIMVIVSLALFSSVALASTQMARLSLNRVNSVILSCLILFPSIFAIGGWVTVGIIETLTPKGVEQWRAVVNPDVNKPTQLSDEEQSELTETMNEGLLLAEINPGSIPIKDPDSTQELKWKKQTADLGTDRIFWNGHKRRFELYGRHPRGLLAYVSADRSGKFLGYHVITSPQKRMIVSFENGVWSLNKSRRKLFLTQLYSTPTQQRLLNVVKPNNRQGFTGKFWPVLTDQTFSVYKSEIPDNDRVVHLTELPGLNTAQQVRLFVSPRHGGAVVIMKQHNAELMHHEILRYDVAGKLISQSTIAGAPSPVATYFGEVEAFGALLSPMVYFSLPYRSFGVYPLAKVQRPQLKMSVWLLGIAFNMMTVLLMLGLIHRIKPGKGVGMVWIACAVVFSLPTLLMFLIWMPWQERKERQGMNNGG